MIITQPERLLLQDQVGRFAHYITGNVLDVGSGRYRRYTPLFTNMKSYKTLDRDGEWKPDIIGSAESIPLEDNSIDSIICTQVLEHVQHPWVALKEMQRVLKPNGVLLLTVPQLNELHEIPHDYYRYTRWGLETLMTEAGLKVEVMDQRGTIHTSLAQLFIRNWIESYKPYQRKWLMIILSPLSTLITRYSVWRDKHCSSEAHKLHALGWCVIAKKI